MTAPTPTSANRDVVVHSLTGFDYDRAEIRLSLRINRPTSGPLDPGERKLRISRIIADVTVHGDLTGDQQEILRQGVESCPVGNILRRGLTLQESIAFETAPAA